MKRLLHIAVALSCVITPLALQANVVVEDGGYGHGVEQQTTRVEGNTSPVPESVKNKKALFDQAAIIIEGDNGSGSGFLAHIKGKNFIVTNIHVIMGNKEIDFRDIHGRLYKPQAYFLAKGQDVAILPIAEEVGYALTMAENVGQLVSRGDRITVLGNSLGGSVVTQLDGEVQGIGPSAVEVSATIVEGNSGSPIIHLETGEVIAVATYISKANEGMSSVEGTRFEKVRRFGHRFDIIQEWQRADLDVMNLQGRVLKDLDKMINEYFALIDEINARGDYGYRGFSHPDVLRDLAHYRAQRPRSQMASEADWLSISREMKARISQRMERSISNAEKELTVDYMKSQLRDRRRAADALIKYLPVD